MVMSYVQRWGHERTHKAVHVNRDLRRKAAKERQVLREKRTRELQIALCYIRRGESKRELARLQGAK